MNLQQLEQIACSERMIPNAPILSSRKITIKATLERVWRIQTDVARWPEWHADLAAAELDGSFDVGTKLTYGRLFKHHLRIAKVRELELVVIFGKYMGFSGITKWKFQPMSATATEVAFTESSSGFLLSRLYSNDKLAEYLDAWLSRLKRQAEKARTE